MCRRPWIIRELFINGSPAGRRKRGRGPTDGQGAQGRERKNERDTKITET